MLNGIDSQPSRPGRTGEYRRSADGWRAFFPKYLNPEPKIELSTSGQNLLAEASTELGRLDGLTEILPDPELFTYSYIRKEAVLSSQIEGTQSTLVDLFDYEAGTVRAEYPSDVREVANFVRALTAALAQLRSRRPISLELIQDTHRTLLGNGARGARLQPGRLKTGQNWIGPAPSPATADYVPPPPKETLALMEDLVGYINRDSRVAPLVRAGVAHSQFETIHPFLDGNGRIGRLLVTLLLLQQGILRQPVLYLSYAIQKHRDEYTRRLQRVRDDGDWEGWLEFLFRAVQETSVQATATARRILELRQRNDRWIADKLGKRAGQGHKLLVLLHRQPVVSVKQISQFTGTTYPPANALVERFVENGLLVEVTGQKRNRFFRYQPYIDILRSD